MTEDSSPAFSSQPWYRKIALIILTPFMFVFVVPIVLILLLCVCLFATVVGTFGEIYFRLSMWRRGRTCSYSHACRQMALDNGTLIVESPTLGWGTSRAWWTSDDLPAKSPFEIPTEAERKQALSPLRCLEWDKWCWDNYCSPNSGRALLLLWAWNGVVLERKLKRRFANANVIFTWTATVFLGEKSPESAANDE